MRGHHQAMPSAALLTEVIEYRAVRKLFVVVPHQYFDAISDTRNVPSPSSVNTLDSRRNNALPHPVCLLTLSRRSLFIAVLISLSCPVQRSDRDPSTRVKYSAPTATLSSSKLKQIVGDCRETTRGGRLKAHMPRESLNERHLKRSAYSWQFSKDLQTREFACPSCFVHHRPCLADVSVA